jgi:hypothetical protein
VHCLDKTRKIKKDNIQSILFRTIVFSFATCLISLARLNKEQFWFSRQRGAIRSVEAAPEPIWLVGLVLGVQDPHLAVREHRHEDAVRVAMVGHRGLLQHPINLLQRKKGKD